MRKGNDMLFEFGPYKADIDVYKTKLFYEKHGLAAGGCDCDGCRNFARAAETLPQPVRSFFTQLGIDIRKPCECYVHYTNEDGTLLYGGFYHVCGTLPNKEGKKRESICQEEYFNVSPDFGICFTDSVCLLEENFPAPVIQLEISANLPWVLQEENSYQTVSLG